MKSLFRLRVVDESHVVPVYITKSYEFVPMSHLHCGYSYHLEDAAIVEYGVAMSISVWCWTKNLGMVVPEFVRFQGDN